MPEQLAYIMQRWIYLIPAEGTQVERIGRPPTGQVRFTHNYDAERHARKQGWSLIKQKDANEILAERMKTNGSQV